MIYSCKFWKCRKEKTRTTAAPKLDGACEHVREVLQQNRCEDTVDDRQEDVSYPDDTPTVMHFNIQSSPTNSAIVASPNSYSLVMQ